MRTPALLVAIVSLCLTLARAQEEPIPPKRSHMVKVGLFGGFTPGVLFPDVTPVNQFLTAGGAAPLKSNGVFMLGGAGAAYIMVVPNLRVGGVGMSGSISSTSLDAATNIRRDAQMKIGYGGLTVEYVVPIWERFDFAFGTMLGTGGMDLTLRKSNGGSNTWGGESGYLGSWGGGFTPAGPDLGSPPDNVTRVLTGSFYIVIPSVAFEYAVTGWVAVRLGASYVAMFAPTWRVDSNYDLLGVPSNVNGNGFMVNMAVLVGTF
ncbi:MAG TPA: hypothetical protein VML00_12650 [Bacteroidota bacterium]|nr:hypothetical protein [Bacteroidota bacterium]